MNLGPAESWALAIAVIVVTVVAIRAVFSWIIAHDDAHRDARRRNGR